MRSGCKSRTTHQFMKYERFKQLWDALITDNPNVPKQTFRMTPTMEAMIAYGQGDKSKVEAVRKFLGR